MPVPQPAEIVCTVPGCGQPTAEVPCLHHQQVFDRAVPDRLKKRDIDDLTTEELAALRARLAHDAAPLFLAAVAFCIRQSLRGF